MEAKPMQEVGGASAVEAYLRLTLAAETVLGQVQKTLRQYGLTPSQLAILELLVRRGPMHHRQIGQWVSRSSGNVTTVVDNLERRGLVRRERSRRDRRCVTVHLTADGRNIAEKILPTYMKEVGRAMGALDEGKQEELRSLCDLLLPEVEREA